MFARFGAGQLSLSLRRSTNYLPKCPRWNSHQWSSTAFLTTIKQNSTGAFSDKNKIPGETSSSASASAAVSAPFSGVAHCTEPMFGPKVLHAFNHDAPLFEAWNDIVPISWSSTSGDGLWVYVRWSDSETQRYPAVWLQDNCRCEKCHNSVTHTRNMYLTDMDFKVIAIIM